jgi:predicted PurR-regulated permease PerM
MLALIILLLIGSFVFISIETQMSDQTKTLLHDIRAGADLLTTKIGPTIMQLNNYFLNLDEINNIS